MSQQYFHSGLQRWADTRVELVARRAEEILKRIQFGDTSHADIAWLRQRNELPEGTFMSVRKMCRRLINKHTIHLITERLKK